MLQSSKLLSLSFHPQLAEGQGLHALRTDTQQSCMWVGMHTTILIFMNESSLPLTLQDELQSSRIVKITLSQRPLSSFGAAQ